MVSLLGRQLYSEPPGANLPKLEADLITARQLLTDAPDDPSRIVWVGRRLGYLWRINEAIDVYTSGIEEHPKYAALYRHRGHRQITLRRFDEAIDDLERAAALIRDVPDEIEPDGMPNARNIPLTTTAFNVWYHLALARYLKGDYAGALAAYRETMKHTRGISDNIVAVSDWMYLTLCRLGREDDARELLRGITQEMEMIENHAYHRRLLMYKGELPPTELIDLENASELDLATLGYGLGAWYLDKGNRGKAISIFERVTSGPYWPAFGFIASEVELARLRSE